MSDENTSSLVIAIVGSCLILVSLIANIAQTVHMHRTDKKLRLST